MARELGVSLDEYYRVDQKVSDATLLSLEDLGAASEDEWRRAQEKFASNPFQDPFICVEGKDLVEKLTSAIDTLPERERLVVFRATPLVRIFPSVAYERRRLVYPRRARNG